MMKLIALSGSLREKSFNTALARAISDLAPAGCSIEVGSIRGIPLYNADAEEAEGIPQAVNDLKDRIAAADGLIVSTPEYNGSMPGVLKNATDWLTRPPGEAKRVFGGRPLGVVGATPGAFGTVHAQTSWLPVWRALGVRPWFGKTLYLSGASKVFDGDGHLIDDATRERIREYVVGFVEFAGS